MENYAQKNHDLKTVLAKDLSVWNLFRSSKRWSSSCYNTLCKYFHRQTLLCTKLTFNKGFVYITRQHSRTRKWSVGCRGPDAHTLWACGGKEVKEEVFQTSHSLLFLAPNASTQLERISYAPAPRMHLLVEDSSKGICSLAPGPSLMQKAARGAGGRRQKGEIKEKKGRANFLQNTLQSWTDTLMQMHPKSS